MFKQYSAYRIGFIAVLLLVLLTSCFRARLIRSSDSLPPVEDIQPIATDEQIEQVDVLTKAAVTSTPTESIPTTTSLPKVTVSAVKGNLFIRRGPDMAYNPIGVLYENTHVEGIARDVLSHWVEIVIPNSKNTGWISVQTKYSNVQGDIASLPEFTITDWPVPAYLINCTYHEMYILPGEYRLPSYLEHPENEMWLYPGTYRVYDLDMPDLPDVMKVDIREGQNIEIMQDGTGEHRKCP